MQRFPADRPIELVYLAPRRVTVAHPRAMSLTFQDLAAISLPGHPEAWDLFRKIVLPALAR